MSAYKYSLPTSSVLVIPIKTADARYDGGIQANNTSDELPSWTAIGIHGFGQVRQAPTRRKRVLWALLVFCGVVVSIRNTRSSFTNYLDNVSTTHITIVPKQRIRMPSIYVCPKNPDAMNETLVRVDIKEHLGPYFRNLDEKGIQRLVAYAIAGAGFHNIEPIIQKLKVDEKMQLSRLFRKWLDGRSYEVFFQTLFEKFGYGCKDMFEKCFYAKHPINCCDIFEQAYVMLRGRCFRLKKFYQNDPDQYGKLLITMKRLRSWFIDKTGQQPQIVIYVTDPGGEPAYFPRYYFNLGEWNQLIIKKRHIKMLDTNEQCHTRCKHCSKAECYIKNWLTQRILDPLNCTVYYEQHHSRGYRICNPWEIVSRYMDIVDVSMNGTKCLPACDREDYFVKLVSSAGIAISDSKKWNPLFRIDAYYSDLEVEKYEEVVTTTVPGFVSELGGQSNLILGFSIVTAIQSIRIIGLSLLKKMQRVLCSMRPCSKWKVKNV